MTATDPVSRWDVVVRAPKAFPDPGPAAPAPAPPVAAVAPVAPAAGPPAPAAPKPVRLPSGPTDHEGLYEGLLWVVRGLEECGRAFTRLSGRVARVEARLAELESAPPAAARLDALDARLRRLESAPAAAPAPVAPAPAAPAPPPADVTAVLAGMRRALATAQVRLARLEGRDRAVSLPDDLAGHVTALEEDVVGVYRELDGIAQRVDDRLRTVAPDPGRLDALERRVDTLDARLARRAASLDRLAATAPPPAPVPAAPVAPPITPPRPPAPFESELTRSALELTPPAVRDRAVSVLSAELERIRRSLGALGEPAPPR